MVNPTLGYEPNVELSKTEIARVQLVGAIDQFLKGNWICSITLAGAAEAIFAGLLANAGVSSVVEDSTAQIEVIRGVMTTAGDCLNPMDGKADNKIYNKWNETRNHLKHHSRGEEAMVKLNLFDEAYWMIKRALANANKAEVGIANEQDFENWIVLNINL